MKVGIIGASGYVGGETIRLLVNHPEVEIVAVTSRKHAGEYLHRIQPSLKGFTDIKFSELDYDKISSECDLVFTAVPHGTATEIVKTFYDRGTRVIDLSADYRLHNPDDYGKWYGWEHPHPHYDGKVSRFCTRAAACHKILMQFQKLPMLYVFLQSVKIFLPTFEPLQVNSQLSASVYLLFIVGDVKFCLFSKLF